MTAENSGSNANQDRLLRQGLRELLGGERPPDLSSQILAAAETEGLLHADPQIKERAMSKSKKWNEGSRGFSLAGIAATVLIAVTIGALLIPAVQSTSERPRSVAQPSDYYSQDDVSHEPASTNFAAPAAEEAESLEYDFQPGYVAPPETPKPSDLPMDVPVAVAADLESSAKSLDLRHLGDLTSPKHRIPLEGSVTGSGIPPQNGTPLAARGARHAEGEGRILEQETVDKLDVSDFDEKSRGEGKGPGQGGDQYTRITDNPFVAVKEQPLSTFSIDVDTASYANVRSFLMQSRRLPPPDAVRIEELVNYFDYDYSGPTDSVPFAAHIEAAGCPWRPEHRLVRIALKGKEVAAAERGPSNLVFLLDVSGSMNEPNKLPLLKRGMQLLAQQLGENDRVAIVVYAGNEGLVLPSTPGGDQRRILAALEQLQAGGSTNGGAGIELAYKVAQENFAKEGVNRVILCTDGDFNVGTTSQAELERLIEQKAKSGVFLTVLGFGRGNFNDAMMEAISNKGNGNYGYIDTENEARKMLGEQLSGTLVTIAKDVKIQVEFNPAHVAGYRLIGYENRLLAKEDFNDDTKDAGEIGAGHTVTALYEIIPAGQAVPAASVDPLKYQPSPAAPKSDASDELLTLKLRYKLPDADKSRLLEFPLVDAGQKFSQASGDFKFAAAVASFGMLLRDSPHRGDATYDAVLEIAQEGRGPDRHGYRREFLELVRTAKGLSGE